MAWNFKKIAIVTGVTVGGGALAFITGGLAAPLVGTIIGSSMGLSGAAATSAGLAALGGGSLAAGGAGMAGGTALISAAAATVGAGSAALSSSTLAVSTKEAKKCPKCDDAVTSEDEFCKNCGHKLTS